MSPHSRQRSGRIPAEPYPLRERFDVSESGCGLGGLAVHCLCGGVRTALRIVKRAAFQHGHENREKSISHPTQSTSVLVPHTTQLRIVLPAVVVMLHADSRPMIQSVSHSLIAAPPHQHEFLLSALTCDGS